MFRVFRKIRKDLIESGQMQKYFFYAVGEVFLVVVGILIALQINNANESRLQRLKEINYLENLRVDLTINIQELDKFIAVRSSRVESAGNIIEYFDGKPLEDLEDFNYHNIHTHLWQKFYQNNNTFQELINSGNLGIISNHAIKDSLMDLQLLYKKMKSDEDHMRYDFEGYVFKPLFDAVDINPMTKNYVYKLTDGGAGERVELSRDAIETLLQDVKYKNGFTLAVFMMTLINSEFEDIKLKSLKLVELIDQELSVH